jgi:hypothetical protein
MKLLPFAKAEPSATMARFVLVCGDGARPRTRSMEYLRQRLEQQLHETFVQWRAYDNISVGSRRELTGSLGTR